MKLIVLIVFSLLNFTKRTYYGKNVLQIFFKRIYLSENGMGCFWTLNCMLIAIKCKCIIV